MNEQSSGFHSSFIIPRSSFSVMSISLLEPAALSAPRWQQSMKEAVRDPRELCRLLGLSPEVEAAAVRAAGAFPVFAPRGYVARMRPGDPNDPLLRQVLPL